MFESNPADLIQELEDMRQGVDYRLEVKIRGFSTLMRPIAISESAQIAANVQKELRALPEEAKNSITENLILAKHTLQTASTSDVGKTDPSITSLMMDRMTTDELQYLHKQYLAVCDKVNPMLEIMSPEAIAEMVEEIKKNSSVLTELSFMELANVCRFLIKGD